MLPLALLSGDSKTIQGSSWLLADRALRKVSGAPLLCAWTSDGENLPHCDFRPPLSRCFYVKFKDDKDTISLHCLKFRCFFANRSPLWIKGKTLGRVVLQLTRFINTRSVDGVPLEQRRTMGISSHHGGFLTGCTHPTTRTGWCLNVADPKSFH